MLAAVALIASIRAVEATYKLHSKFKNDSSAPQSPQVMSDGKSISEPSKGKYALLQNHLLNIPPGVHDVTLTFRQIAQLIGDSDLCDTAYKHRQWWENQSDYSKRPQAKAWMEAGWIVEYVNQQRDGGWVKFTRK